MERFFLVDGPSLLYRAYHAIGHLSTSKGIPTNAVYGMNTMLGKILKEEAPEFMSVAWDAPGPTLRHQAFEAYKESRPGMPSDLAQQIPYVKTLLEALGLPLLEYPGYEADDILATIAAQVEPLPIEVVLVTADKDLLQLVGPKVKALSINKGEKTWTDEAGVLEKWQVRPERIVDLLGLMGDSIDDIPGVPGVGEVTAAKLLRQFGSLEALYANLHLVSGPKLRETLAKYRDQAFLSRRLAVLDRSVPIAVDLEQFRRREPDWERLRRLWTELEFRTLLETLPQKAVEVVREPVALLSNAGALSAYCQRLPSEPRLATWWVIEGSAPDLNAIGVGLYALETGPAFVTKELLKALPECHLIGHDMKTAIGWARQANLQVRSFDDSAVASYLLDPGRTDYSLDRLSLERFGQSLSPWPSPVETEAVAGAAGERARWVSKLWEAARADLERDQMWNLYRDVELPLVHVLAAMECVGIRVAVDRLEVMAKELERDLDNLTREIHALAGQSFNINSPKQLAGILFEQLKLPTIKRTKTGYSTDSDVLEQLALGHPLPAKILEFRQIAKLKSTYVDALPSLIHPRTGRIHSSFNQLGTATGRLSSANPNMQNIPIRSELGRRIRQAFVAEPGWQLLAADYSQVELRVLAHCAGEDVLIDSFRRGEDIHTRTASEVFHVEPERVTEEMRRVAKTVNFGVIYGVSAFGLGQATGVDRAAAQKYLDDYFAQHRRIKAYIEATLAEGRTKGYVSTLLCRRRYLPELKSSNPNIRGMAERMAMNAPIQGSAADLIKIAMVRMHEALRDRGLQSRMLLQVHDELLFEVPATEVEEMKTLAREVMESAMSLAVPIKVDIKVGLDWSQV
ncbi:MAG TPA: DNA polymerase I [Methylomirabilota bacterium]|nr:DNA polymerase I [Methylomirabilota bacterium]